ncbi:hypothetical protein D3C76_457150 [compost metagenome]
MFSLFHCGDGTQVTKTQDGVEIRHPASSYRIAITSNCPCTVVTGWNDDQLVKGISGLGFMQQIETSMVAFEMKNAMKAQFTITAHQN